MDKITELFLWHLVDIVLFAAILVYFLIDRRIYAFVRGLFLTACSLLLVSQILHIFMYTLEIEAIKNVFSRGQTLNFLDIAINLLGYFLLAFGITLLIGREYKERGGQQERPPMKGKRRNIGISLLLFTVTLGVYFPFWLYRTVKDLRNNFESEIPYTPGRAVGFLFIPFFNIYWGFYIWFSLPRRVKQIEEKYFGGNVGFCFHPVLVSVLLILLSLVANLPHEESQLAIAKYFFGGFGIISLWLTIQAKLNVFFDFSEKRAGLQQAIS